MINPTDPAARLAIDVKDTGALRQAARDNSPEALKATAKQFEALFMNMVLKSMREASPQEGLFDSQQSKMYTSMLDQQLSQTMASRGVGLADVLIRQLSNVVNPQAVPPEGMPPAPAAATPTNTPAALPAISDSARSNPSAPAHVRAFQERLGAHADEASRATGIPAKFMLGQA